MNEEDVEMLALIANSAKFLWESHDDEKEVHGGLRKRKEHIVVDVQCYRHLSDKTFREHFRMNRMLFQKLLVVVGNHLQERGRMIRLRTPLDTCLMMAVWILATHDSFRSVATKFNVPSRGTVHFHYVVIIEALRELSPNFIQWPNEFERDNISRRFYQKYGYPGVAGCIDGTHIYITAPLVQPARYYNRFRKTSVLLQAVSDHRKVFRDIYMGEPGSVHDARMFQRSPLSHLLLNAENMLTPDEHILGDGAYTLTDKVITPYRDNGRLNRRQRRHNYTHASARSEVERAFGLNKNKWRRQKFFQASSHEYVVDTIVASCVLHNFILLDGEPYALIGNMPQLLAAARGAADNDDDPNDPGQVNADVREIEGNDVIPEIDPALPPARAAGRLKRDFIAYMIYPHED